MASAFPPSYYSGGNDLCTPLQATESAQGCLGSYKGRVVLGKSGDEKEVLLGALPLLIYRCKKLAGKRCLNY